MSAICIARARENIAAVVGDTRHITRCRFLSETVGELNFVVYTLKVCSLAFLTQ